nr:MAG TPA: hypothetical protein [Caudoviricetes sp.]
MKNSANGWIASSVRRGEGRSLGGLVYQQTYSTSGRRQRCGKGAIQYDAQCKEGYFGRR